MPLQEKQEESHTPDKKLDAEAQLGTGDNPGTPAEAGESATGNKNKPAEFIETTEKKTDEMAQGQADVPEANSIKRPDVEEDGAAEEAGNPIKVPGISFSTSGRFIEFASETPACPCAISSVFFSVVSLTSAGLFLFPLPVTRVRVGVRSGPGLGFGQG